MDYVSTDFLAHLAYGHCRDAAIRLIAQAAELFGDVLSCDDVIGMHHKCEGCHFASHIKRDQGLHQGKPVGKATLPGESLHADEVRPV